MANLSIQESAIIRTISPNEKMPAMDKDIYFAAGQSALDCIDLCLHAARKSAYDVRRILDLPCGHGRVLRYLKAAFPEAEITACDIMRDGVDFCALNFGAVPVYSEDDPTKIPFKRDFFDLIWVGSLFTHLNAGLWLRFLRVFRSVLHPQGLLVFTTHGYDAYRRMVTEDFNFCIPYDRKSAILYEYDHNGFGFVQYPGNDSYYGLSLSSPEWVLKQITNLGSLRVVCFSEIAWVNFHDCFACVRDPDWQHPQTLVDR
jgi:SAM-dependent methyltransferase